VRVNFLQFWEQDQGGGRISCYEHADMHWGRSVPFTHWLEKARFREIVADELWISLLIRVEKSKYNVGLKSNTLHIQYSHINE